MDKVTEKRFTGAEVQQALASAREKISLVVGLPQSKPEVGADPRAAFFQFSANNDVTAFMKQNDFAKHMKENGWKAAHISSDENDIHLMIALPPDFMADPNKAMGNLYKAAKASGMAADIGPEEVKLTSAEVSAINYGVKNKTNMAEITAHYESGEIRKQLAAEGVEVTADVAASVYEVRNHSYKKLTNSEAVALAEMKNAADAITGKWSNVSTSYTGEADINYVGRNKAEVDALYDRLTKNMPADKTKWPFEITKHEPGEGQHDDMLVIKPNKAREAEFYQDPNKMMAEFAKQAGGQNYDPAKHAISSGSIEAFGRLKEKQEVGQFISDADTKLYDGAQPEFFERLKKIVGIEGKTEYPAGTEGVGARQVKDLLKNVSMSSADGFDEKEKQDINGQIKDLAEKMKGKIQDSDNITSEERSEARKSMNDMKQNMEKQIDNKAPAPRR